MKDSRAFKDIGGDIQRKSHEIQEYLSKITSLLNGWNKGSNIVVFEDCSVDAYTVMRILAKNNYRCISCKTREHFMALLSGGMIGMVITDVLMPDMDGLEVAKLLINSDVPFLAMSGLDRGEGQAKEIIEIGGDFINKGDIINSLMGFVEDKFGDPIRERRDD